MAARGQVGERPLGRAPGGRGGRGRWLARPVDWNDEPGRHGSTGGCAALGPVSAYEMVTRRAVDDIEKEVGRLEAKMNALMVGMALTFGVEVWKAFLR